MGMKKVCTGIPALKLLPQDPKLGSYSDFDNDVLQGQSRSLPG